MRLNERHAAIAVLFLVVILLVGFFWQDESADPAPAGADQQLARQVEAPRTPGQVQASERPDRLSPRGGAPLGGLDEVPTTVEPVSTRGLREEAHSVEPGASAPSVSRAELPAPSRDLEARPSAVRVDELPGGLVPGGNAAPTEMEELAGLAANARDRGRFLTQPSGPALEPVKTAASTRDERVAAATAPAATSASTGSAREYTVRPGDSLSAIAQKECGTTESTDAICFLNGLSDPNKIRVGMVLKLPAKTSPSTAAPARIASRAPVATGGRRTVTIRSGELLSTVLERELGTYKRSIAAVKRLNPDLDPDWVAVGQSIILPLPAELSPVPAGAARSRAVASQGRRVASSSQRADRSKYVVR